MSAPAPDDRIAFLVLAHAQPRQLARLVPLLAPGDGRADVFVHVDRKSSQAGFATALARAEVRFVAERHAVWWGGFGMVEAMCALLRAALAAGPDYAAFVFLSESCFPIRPLRDLHALIRARPGHNFIRFVDCRPYPELMRRIDRYWVWDSPLDRLGTRPTPSTILLGKALKFALRAGGRHVPKRLDRFLGQFVPCWGSQWFALSAAGARAALRRVETDSVLRHVYRYAFVPDEQIFHTVCASSDLLGSTDGYCAYRGDRLSDVANLHLLSPAYPDFFDESRFAEIRSSDRYFIRKVHPVLSASLMDRIERELLAP